ncbi:biopolymer transporter ExbD [Shimia sp. CNT1-13L.2]|uniref:ExbD/TolR family protein n=1 Tax=Shimia sp. CNT1-13L.2 TaxID=2959663 RepID=UPI0020CC084B|nr:biopolymer transporter ExbD [Shimia sp. CNT1-13L.2]MCP9484086.1 biopolymer transporter ExbD [Shimia sp. CNT1-13L.2]
MLSLPASRPRKRPSLTPMIDVVFLLLVFFMLASQFGIDRVLPLGAGGQSSAYSGPPRLVAIEQDGVLLNGQRMSIEDLAGALTPLVTSQADAIVLRPGDGVSLQSLMNVASVLEVAGFTTLLVTE